MDRRAFISLSSAAVVAACGKVTASQPRAQKQPRQGPAKMHVGTQRGPTTAEMLKFFKRHGVDHICGYPPNPGPQGHWSVEDLEKTRELCEAHGIALDMVALPFLTSSHIDRERRGAIMLADDPQRDRDIESIHRMIEGCAKVGIPAFKYNLCLLGVMRTGSMPGRGGSRYSTWQLAKAPAKPLTRAGRITEDVFWQRITYFLQRVIPVCNQHRIRAACHPHDPGVAPEGFQGVVRVLGTVEGLKRFISIEESAYHGLNFCIGSVSEMLQDPAREINDVIRFFGSRKKIFNVHFRNIRGRRDSFQEVFPDQGDVDMLQAAKTLHDVGYPYMVMPDHMPGHPDDPQGRQAFAFGYGYIKAILQAVTGASR